MPEIFQHQHQVAESEIDEQGHVNNIAYLHWMQSAAVKHSSAQGWSGERYQAAGWAWVVRSHSIEYRRPAFSGENITVWTWVADMNRASSLRKYEIRRGTELLARAQTNWAFVNTKDARLQRIPEEVSTCFQIIDQEASAKIQAMLRQSAPDHKLPPSLASDV